MKKLQRTAGGAVLAVGGVAAAILSAPATASALGWQANDMISQTTGTTGMTAAQINQNTLATWVQNLTTWILGIAIVMFVLKVVLTAIDRLIFGNTEDKTDARNSSGRSSTVGNGGGVLCKIPLIGAYAPSMEWKDIFIHFGKNLAIVAGAWVIVQIVTGVILFVFEALTQGV